MQIVPDAKNCPHEMAEMGLDVEKLSVERLWVQKHRCNIIKKVGACSCIGGTPSWSASTGSGTARGTCAHMAPSLSWKARSGCWLSHSQALPPRAWDRLRIPPKLCLIYFIGALLGVHFDFTAVVKNWWEEELGHDLLCSVDFLHPE